MNYRHVYHAGNFADVLKHLILSLVITHLKRKTTPFRVIDTHAGAGLYDLSSPEAQKTGEWLEGIGRLLSADLPASVAAAMAPYLDVVRRFNLAAAGGAAGEGGRGDLLFYPGSPIIAAELMRSQDYLIANELHPADFEALGATMSAYSNVKVMNLDGYVAEKSVLPPKERRGVVLIDPPFEEPGELGRLFQGVRQGVKRFANGTFLIWYPIKDPRPVAAFKRELAGLGLDKLTAVEFFRQAPDDLERLNGHGLVMLNAPFTLGDDLKEILPVLVEILGRDKGAFFEITAL
ncbi:MAG: 23S rRNA (adenine(2030)-N(6))-methyltransferase RlmJ [Alphaproteobacteria bacterium]|nr:23S rRNA (adenine(2030)-N(6))-methyltransferase RlmJ [Alphaproteobacteria bacterium]